MKVIGQPYVKQAFYREIAWMRWALRGIIFSAICLASGQVFESKFFPVLENVTVSRVRIEGEKLCFIMHLDKVRPAKGVFYVGQLYYGDEDTHSFVGLDHYFGQPYGGTLLGAPIGHYDSDTCVDVQSSRAKEVWRLGLRILIRYDVPYRPWRLDQPEFWIDAYRGTHY